MKTPSGKLAALTILLLSAILLLAPMRAGTDDYITVSAKSVKMNIGDTYDIDYTLYSNMRQAVTYTSSNEGVATVDSQGMVTAKNPGSAAIRLISRSGARAQVAIEVAGKPADRMELSADRIVLDKGQISGLKAVFNKDAVDTRVVWHSENTDVATIDAMGRISAVGGGETIITATNAGGLSASATVKVNVKGDVVHPTPEDLTVGVGASIQMDCYYLPSDATDEIKRWTSSNTSVATVSADGVVTAKGVGQSVISVFTENGLSGSTLIAVGPSASDFELSPSAVTIERGHTLQLSPRFLDAQGNLSEGYERHYIEWTTTTPDVATVDENGMVTGVSSGLARITARCDGMTASCIVTVQVLPHAIALDRSEIWLMQAETREPIQLTASLTPADPDDATVIYATDNPMVAYVDPDGCVTMTGAFGTAVITATTASGAQASCTINVVTEMPAEAAQN